MTSAATESDSPASDTPQYPHHARRRIPLVLFAIAAVLSLIAALGGYEAVKRNNPTFRAQAAINLDQPLKVAASTNAGEVDKLARLRQTYIGVVRFDSVVDAVAKQTRLSRSQVRSRIFAAADPSSLLLIVGANDASTTSAKRVATALANEVVVYVQQSQEKAKIPDNDRVTAAIVVTPRAAAQIAPTTRKAVTSGVVAGLIVFLVIVGLGSLARRPN